MPYVDELVARHADRVSVWPSRELGRFDLDEPGPGSRRRRLVYACGPEELLAALEDSARPAGRTRSSSSSGSPPAAVEHGAEPAVRGDARPQRDAS